MTSFDTIYVNNIAVSKGKVSVIEDVMMGEYIDEIEEIVISAEAKRNTENALITMKMKSSNLIDGISASSFRK